MVTTAKTAQLRDWFGHRPSMKRFTLCLMIAFSFCQLAVTNTATAATYYVDDANGLDSNPGTEGQPWKTITKAQASASSGDTVYLRNGNYGAFIDYNTSRTDWVTYKAVAGHTPIFTYIELGRWDGPYNLYLRFEAITVTPGNASQYYRAVFVNKANYITLYNLTISGPGISAWGEHNRGIYLADCENIVVEKCTVKDYEYGIGSKLANNVTVSNCEITNTQQGITAWGQNWLITTNHIHDLYSDGIIVSCANSTLEYNRIHDIDRPVVYTYNGGASYNDATKTITANSGTPFASWQAGYCQFVILTVGGQRLSSDNYAVGSFTGNTITLKTNIGQNYPSITLIETTAGYHLDGIQFYSGTGSFDPTYNVIRGNKIYNIGKYTWSDAQGIWVGSGSGSDYHHLTFENNLIYNIFGSGRWFGTVGTNTHMVFRNNTIPGGWIAFQENTQLDQLTGNIVRWLDIMMTNQNTPPPVYENYNIVRDWWVHIDKTKFTPGQQSIELMNDQLFANLFVDSSNDDYHLAPNSVAINFGNSTYAPATDILGNSRSSPPDAGCYEYVGAQSTPEPNNPPSDACEPNLVGYLKFDEGSGTTANDSSGFGTAGDLINGPTWTTQGEISFDGSDNAVEISTANLNAGGGAIALWAYPNAFSKSRHFLFGHTWSQSNRIQVYCDASGTLCVGLGDNAGLSTNIQTLNAHEWYHIALVWNGTNYVVYVDGVQKVTGTYSGLSALQAYADIGNNGNRSGRTEGFDGLIDEVRLYDKPLAASGIADLALMFLPIGDKTVVEGEELRFSIRAKSGSIVELSDPNLPSLPSFASNVFSWTPDYDDAGTYELEFTAPHDSGEDFEKVAVTVMDAQQAEPVGHWQFDESSDDIAYDASESNNTGYLRNGLARDLGKINGALVFSVPNDAVEIRTTNFNPNTGTIAMWVYVERQTLSRHYLFGHITESMANRIQLYLKYGNLCLGLGNSHETRTNIQRLQNQKWYHIVLTWSPTTYSVYVDGLPKASGVYPGLTGLADHADIGNNGASRDKALNGKIDDVRIYDRVLGTAEIAQLAVGN